MSCIGGLGFRILGAFSCAVYRGLGFRVEGLGVQGESCNVRFHPAAVPSHLGKS